MHKKQLIPLFFLLFLSSCAVIPQTLDERLAAAYVTNSSIRITASRALNAGRIDADQGRAVLRLTDQARSLLDASADGDERGLDLAIEILEELERYLE